MPVWTGFIAGGWRQRNASRSQNKTPHLRKLRTYFVSPSFRFLSRKGRGALLLKLPLHREIDDVEQRALDRVVGEQAEGVAGDGAVMARTIDGVVQGVRPAQ